MNTPDINAIVFYDLMQPCPCSDTALDKLLKAKCINTYHSKTIFEFENKGLLLKVESRNYENLADLKLIAIDRKNDKESVLLLDKPDLGALVLLMSRLFAEDVQLSDESFTAEQLPNVDLVVGKFSSRLKKYLIGGAVHKSYPFAFQFHLKEDDYSNLLSVLKAELVSWNH